VGSLDFFEVTTALAVAGAVGWACWNTVSPLIAAARQRRIERRVWGKHRERLERERLGLGPYREEEPTFLRDQRPRDRGRR
jgi:hypothetical protein